MNRPSLLTLKDIQVWYPVRKGWLARTQGHIKAVDGVSMTIEPGTTYGLVGESGCGKTTLGRAIMGLEKPRAGSLDFEGRNLRTEVYDLALRRRLQMIFQDPASSLNPRLTVTDILAEGLDYHGLLKGSREEAAAALLQEVGLDASMLYRYSFEFSGGQRQRLCIARALALRPQLLICDEPVSALDVSVQAQVINLLLDLKEKYGMALLFISHDLSVVRFMADRVGVMYLGRIVEEGPAELVFKAPQHPYTQALLAAAPTLGGDRKRIRVTPGEMPSPRNPPPGCPFHARCPKAMLVCKVDYPAERVAETHRVSCHLYR